MRELDVNGHAASMLRKHREVNNGAQLSLPFESFQDPAYSTVLLTSRAGGPPQSALWKRPHRHIQSCFSSDSMPQGDVTINHHTNTSAHSDHLSRLFTACITLPVWHIFTAFWTE